MEKNETSEVSYDRILQILQDYVTADAEASETGYIREMLTDTCGCSKQEIEFLGFDWLFPEEYFEEC